MTRSLAKRLALCALAAAAAVTSPAAGADERATGGAAAPPTPATQGTIRVQGSQVTLSVRAGTMLRRIARFRGNAPASQAGRTVAIERFDDATSTWAAVTTATIGSDGSYLARWRTDRAGEYRVRAVLRSAGRAVAAASTPELAITVHRPAAATWYGPGFYGRRTACGRRMSRSLLGVAHRRLPCGTEVAVLYRGRRITVPVVDRGPFRPGTRWDLTAATARALGFEGAGRVGAVRITPAR